VIPIRARTDSPITTFKALPAMSPDHPLAKQGVVCPACDGPLTEEPFTLVLVGFTDDTLESGKLWGNGATVPVHVRCTGQGRASNVGPMDDEAAGYAPGALTAYLAAITDAIDAFDDGRMKLGEFKRIVLNTPKRVA
jgi:hypothetical protein